MEPPKPQNEINKQEIMVLLLLGASSASLLPSFDFPPALSFYVHFFSFENPSGNLYENKTFIHRKLENKIEYS
jgi:hypothetical protein